MTLNYSGSCTHRRGCAHSVRDLVQVLEGFESPAQFDDSVPAFLGHQRAGALVELAQDLVARERVGGCAVRAIDGLLELLAVPELDHDPAAETAAARGNGLDPLHQLARGGALYGFVGVLVDPRAPVECDRRHVV